MLSQTLDEQQMTSWEKLGSELDRAKSMDVAEVKSLLSADEKGRIYQSIDNCMTILQLDPILSGAICHNDLTGKMDLVRDLGWGKPQGGGIRDVDVNQIEWYLERAYGFKNYKAISKALNIVASQNHFHPIKDYLENLKWDGKSRSAEVLPMFLGAEKCDYTTEALTLMMQAMIRRIYEPGCKFEIMVCLVGGQGAGKSTFFRFLAIKDEWFSDDLSRLGDENVYRRLQGHWLIEMAEMLGTVNAKTVEEIKSFLSRQKDNYKIPYETHPEDRPRQCVFVGTSNTLDFLPLDRSGNRRFVPIMIQPEKAGTHILADEKVSRRYIDQLWAEMMVYYKENHHRPLKLSKDTEDHLKELQKDFMPEDTKDGMIQEWLDGCKEDYVCSLMIYREALRHEYGEPKQYELREINSIMNHSISGWYKAPQHRFAGYGRQGSWKRQDNPSDFVSVPEAEQSKIPFD